MADHITDSACPFCGGDNVTVDRVARFPDAAPELQTDELGAFAYSVRCLSCAAVGPWTKSHTSAIARWEMRP